MNKILGLIVVVLVPITVLSFKNEEIEPEIAVYQATTLEKYSLELPIKEESEENKEIDFDENQEIYKEDFAEKGEIEAPKQVLISQNADKSNAYYINLEDYIVGVVAGEMPASFEEEALKAQAVAARTYAVYKMQNIDGYVLATSVNDQVYLTQEEMQKKWGSDYDYYLARIKEAVEATKNEVLTYNDEVIIAYYFAISNGYTDNSQAVFNVSHAYLEGVDSSWDKNYQAYESVRVMSKSTFCNKLGISCDDINITNLVRADNHYVRSITINGQTFTGREVFNKLSLRSHDFEIKVNAQDITITTYGFGHGVGMSQYGAQGMAKEGYTYEDILTHYYQNTQLTKL